MKKLILPLLVICGSTLALASSSFAFRGSISFNEAEVRQHQAALPVIMNVAAKCLQQDLDRHQLFIHRYGVSAFYGENARFAKVIGVDEFGQATKRSTTDDEKRQQLRERGLPEYLVQQLVPVHACRSSSDCPMKMQPSSCIGLALKCLQRGFASAGQSGTWARLRQFTRENDVTGESLLYALRFLGWRTVYWNPDTSKARQWDLSEQKRYPGNPQRIWGKHVQTLASVMSRQIYSGVEVDDITSAVNFGRSSPEVFRRVPFYVGIAHQGYHVFPGSYGRIIEAHSTREINDPDEVQTSVFSPLAEGGGPRGGPYKSGIVAIPPGY